MSMPTHCTEEYALGLKKTNIKYTISSFIARKLSARDAGLIISFQSEEKLIGF